MFKRNNKKITKNGFTLIELLVAITVFSLIIGAVLGIFISGIRSQRRALDSQELLNEVSSALEQMSRSLRMAKQEDSSFSGDCPGDGKSYFINNTYNGIKFINVLESDYFCQEFFLDIDGKLKRNNYDGVLKELISLDKIEIKVLKFNLIETDAQPRVTILLVAQIKNNGPKISVQTTISQRNIYQ